MKKNHTSTAWLTWGIMLVGANLRLPITGRCQSAAAHHDDPTVAADN